MRAGTLNSMRVTKLTWYANGGFKNSLCWRRQVRGSWQYYLSWS
jgi:hypothetical protein